MSDIGDLCICFRADWSDDDWIELRVEVCDVFSVSMSKYYVGYDWFEEVSTKLQKFSRQNDGGICTLEIGKLGSAPFGSAFWVQLDFWTLDELYITAKQQSRFGKFKNQDVYNEATIHLRTTPEFLSRFIEELIAVKFFEQEEAKLRCVYRPEA